MDLVYPLKRSAGNYGELRYSLRSVSKNFEHDRVFLVGGCPSWATNLIHIEPERGTGKFDDAAGNVRAAIADPRVSDPFILMNDDFFVMKPVSELPVLNRGRLDDVIENHVESSYRQAMRQARSVLTDLGYRDLLSFELHVPFVVEKAALTAAMDMGQGLYRWQYRTAYGAVQGLTGTSVKDVKVYDHAAPLDPDATFVSTSDQAFALGRVGTALKLAFTRRSPYEQK